MTSDERVSEADNDTLDIWVEWDGLINCDHLDQRDEVVCGARLHDERDWLCSAGRPLLQIRHLWYRRQEAGGRVTLWYVSAHTDNDDPDSVGNRLADFEANRARACPSHPSPLNVRPLPIEHCEPYMYIKLLDSSMVINDIRSSALQLIKSTVYHKRKSKLIAIYPFNSTRTFRASWPTFGSHSSDVVSRFDCFRLSWSFHPRSRIQPLALACQGSRRPPWLDGLAISTNS